MNNQILLLCLLLFWIIFYIWGTLNLIGNINEKLERLNPDMHKIHLPSKVVYFVPQWCSRAGLSPKFAVRKQDVYILILILTIITYIYGIILLILSITLFFVIENIIYMFFAPFVLDIPIIGINIYYYFAQEKKVRKQYMHLESSFEISNNNKNKEDNKQEK